MMSHELMTHYLLLSSSKPIIIGIKHVRYQSLHVFQLHFHEQSSRRKKKEIFLKKKSTKSVFCSKKIHFFLFENENQVKCIKLENKFMSISWLGCSVLTKKLDKNKLYILHILYTV